MRPANIRCKRFTLELTDLRYVISGEAVPTLIAKNRSVRVFAEELPLQAGRLKVSGRLPEAATLRREMLNFRVRITAAANDTYAAWREGEHDDTVLAVALATWAGEALRKRQMRVY